MAYRLPDSFRKQAATPTLTPTPDANVNFNLPDWALLARFLGWVGLGVSVALILGFVLVRLLRYTRQLGLKKWRARESQSVDNLRVKGSSEQLTRSLPLRRIAQEMRRYRAFDESDLDVTKTVEETIRAGIFTPAFTSRKALPEYLVLIDRATFADQQARLVDDILNRLVKNDVLIERYFFQEDPRICRKDGLKAQFQTLQDLALQHPRHYLLIFSDGAGFFNMLTGRPHRWLESFGSWPKRLLLTSEVQAGDYRDWVLTELGFCVLPAGRAGLAAMSESLDGGLPRRGSDAPSGTPLPPLLRGRPGQWLKSHPPRPELLDELCGQLKSFLGEVGYYWLSACAVYPLLYRDMTFYLGERLATQEDLFETYSKLVRLPWFRSGGMPDWLRARLIIDLDETKERAIRTSLEDLLIGSLKQPDGFVLPLVTAPKPDAQDESNFFRRGLAKLKDEVRALSRRKLAEDILRSQTDDSRLCDYVAVTFMSGRKPNKLAVTVPRELYPVLYPSGLPVIDRTLGVTIIVSALFASSMLVYPIVLAGTLPAIAGSLVVWSFFMGLNVWAVRELMRGSRVTVAPHADDEISQPSTETAAATAAADTTTKSEEAVGGHDVVAEMVQEDAARDDSVTTDTNVNRPPARPTSTSSNILPIFVSSTWLDLAPERAAVEAAVQRLRETKFVGIEYFSSRDESTRQASLYDIDRSSVYIGIIAGRYGSGITEAEYDRAHQNGLPCFIYFKDDAAIPAERHDTEPEKLAKLDAFKQKLRANQVVSFDFKSPEDLAAKVTADIHRWLFDNYLAPRLQGEFRGDLSTLHQLRAPVGDFVGRGKEVEELIATLRRGGSAAIAGISGMGGIGKTELAFYVAERLREVYPDAQLVLDMRGTDDNPRDPADALASCVRVFLGLEQHLPDNVPELTQLYRSVLEGKRALILLDNARDSAQVRPLLPPAGSALLVTSRETISLPRMKRITLEQMEPEVARELLMLIAPRVTTDVADEICMLCGYLPLAIRAAGSLLDVTPDLDPADYARLLSNERTRLQDIGVDPMISTGVEASIGLSYSRLAPDAARVYRQLSVFPDHFDAAAEQAVCQDDNHRHLSDLLRRNLVSYNPDTLRYRLHNLARLYADSRMSVEERSACQQRHALHYLEVLRAAQELYWKGGEHLMQGLTYFDVELKNIQAGWTWAESQFRSNKLAARMCNEYPLVAARLLDLRQHPRERILWLEAALLAARQLGERQAEGEHLGNLGETYLNLGEYSRATEFLQQQLSFARQLGNKRGQAQSLSNLGIAAYYEKDLRRAIDYQEQSLVLSRETRERRDEAVALGNLGSAYIELGEIRRAIEYNEQSLVIAREMGDRFREGLTLGNLGAAYASLGEPQRALEFYEQCLLIAREIGDRRVEGEALFNLGVTFDGLGDRSKAINYADAALDILEQIESPQAARVSEQLSQWRDPAK